MSSIKLFHLQGLRGVAIISVILFHFFPSQFPNGYIGVDIFFLLSGYLMTMMMARYKTIKSPEIFDFLYKRLKRIAPLYFLSIFITLLVLQPAPSALKSANIDPAMNAILFITNLIRPDDLTGYFEKLGSAVDLFTHTWSLSLEVQYYLFFPIIFILFRLFSAKNGQNLLIFGSIFSFLFYISADDFTSFNSMFARIWQFNAGTLSYFYSNPPKLANLDNEQLISFENKKTKSTVVERSKEIPDEFNIVKLCLLVLLVLLLSHKLIESDFSRICSIFLTMAIVQQGQGLSLMENKFIVFIGEISYGWYLFHWPIAAYCKSEHYQLPGLLGALGISFLISVVVHFIFEKRYLSWEKPVICGLVAVLLTANLTLLLTTRAPLSGNQNGKNEELKHLSVSTKVWENSFLYPSDFIENVTLGYENKTNAERIELNKWYSSTDMGRLTSFCKKNIKTNISMEIRCQLNEGANTTAKERLLVIGNSWAANVMPTIRDECQHKFSHLELSWAATCEPLVPTWVEDKVDCKNDERMYVGVVKEFQPDVLFIISRNFKMFKIHNGSTPFNDFYFKTATRRLTEIQKHVKKQIFILDAFPDFNSVPVTDTLNDHLAKNRTFTSEAHGAMTKPYAIAKMRYSRLVAECPKCILFDYTPQFFFNGRFYLYDPKYLISFLSTYSHLNPPGLERVRPILRRLCGLI